MDSIFHLGEAERTAFLRHMLQCFGSTYICIWSYSPLPSNCLLFLDGFYHDEKLQQPSTSSGSLSTRLFSSYCGSGNYIDNGRVPGFAFRNNVPYLEMQADYLHSMVSSQVQLQFYQEAGIKTTVFMGCAMGEIELGFSTEPPVNLQMEIQSWFPSDFSRQTPHPTNEISSPSPSVESIKCFGIPISSSLLLQESASVAAPISTIPHPQSRTIPNLPFPSMEAEDHAITTAILAVLSSSPSSHQIPQNLPHDHRPAFTSYRPALPPVAPVDHKPNLFMKAVMFFKNLDMATRGELQIQGNQPSANQMHHMIAERRRREKLNESFQILKTLLPQVTKKDKVSLLSSTTEYLSSLKSQLGELTRRNVALETQISTAEGGSGEEILGIATSAQRRNVVEIACVSPSTSEATFLDLRMSLRSEKCSLTDFVARVLGFLKEKGNVSLQSVHSSTRMVESTPVHSLVLRLKVEGNAIDEAGFQEAVRSVVDDLTH